MYQALYQTLCSSYKVPTRKWFPNFKKRKKEKPSLWCSTLVAHVGLQTMFIIKYFAGPEWNQKPSLRSNVLIASKLSMCALSIKPDENALLRFRRKKKPRIPNLKWHLSQK